MGFRSRWPITVFLVPAPSMDVVAVGSTYESPSFHAVSFDWAVTTAAGGATEVKSPSVEAPKVWLLKPPAWAPTTGLSMPPYRPSQIRPNLSMRKLYPMSPHPRPSVWKT